MSNNPIQTALLSVFDKSGLVPFAEGLVKAGISLISTGGTAKALREAGMSVKDLSDHTGFPEMLDGRVKTLHPKVHGGLLFRRDDETHRAAVAAHGIDPIDLVVVNLYPFEETVARSGVTVPEAIEQIDIGGPSMLRSAAKNHDAVTVVVDPSDYDRVLGEIQRNGRTSPELRRELAARVFAKTASYDGAIAAYFEGILSSKDPADSGAAEVETELPAELRIAAPRAQSLRYGENPHQRAALYGKFGDTYRQLHGKALSYNNILDLTAAAALIDEFTGDDPTLAILKHTNPCGLGRGPSLRTAWERAFATDQQAPFGGIIAVNQPLDRSCAEAIAGIFSEVIVAPAFESDALEMLQKKKNLRLITWNPQSSTSNSAPLDVRSVGADSFLLQEHDTKTVRRADLKVVTRREPTDEEWRAMLFGWRTVKHVKSNAIVYAGPDRTLGVGAGQMSRVDASRIAVRKAADAGLSLRGSVVCSDAFFPFPDGLIAAADAGASAAIQPGGSVRDEEVIAAANEREMAMAFTGVRHFRH